MHPQRRLGIPLFLALASVVAACGGDEESGTGGSGGSTVAITATDDSCEIESTELPAGQTTFTVINEGPSVTEVYVYGEADGEFSTVVSEVENIGPGTSRDMEVDLTSGTYEIACKPGQTGDGIRTLITVTGEAAESTGGP